MAIKLYMDQHVPKAITTGLQLREVDVLTAHEDGASEFEDSILLDRASERGRVLFSQDSDLLANATKRQMEGLFFRGIIYAHQLRAPIGICIRDLESIAKSGEPEDFINMV